MPCCFIFRFNNTTSFCNSSIGQVVRDAGPYISGPRYTESARAFFGGWQGRCRFPIAAPAQIGKRSSTATQQHNNKVVKNGGLYKRGAGLRLMGFLEVVGPCCVCQTVISCNPEFVPSVRIDGERQQVCKSCFVDWNRRRIENGLHPVKLHPEAYKPLEVP